MSIVTFIPVFFFQTMKYFLASFLCILFSSSSMFAFYTPRSRGDRCIDACTKYTSDSRMASVCQRCTKYPPIEIKFCTYACGHRHSDDWLCIICAKCFFYGKHLMKEVCRRACRDTTKAENKIICENPRCDIFY